MGSASVGVGCTDLGKGRKGHDSRIWQFERIQAHRILDLDWRETEVASKATGGGANFLGGRLLVLETPTPVLASTGAHEIESLG